MKIKAHKSKLSGRITVPGSKSHTIRALILAAMADGTSHISNPLPSNDCLSTVEAIKKVGAKAELSDGLWTITGAGKNLHLPDDCIDAGNSGSLMYFLCPVLSTLSGECTFTGDESLCTRPVGHLLDALNQLGAGAKSLRGNDCSPFSFCGSIDVNKTLKTDGKLSQYISGFMMAASRLNGTLKIELSDPKETPYLTMTKLWLESVGVNCQISDDFKNISVQGPVQIKAFDRAVPSDWEGVAFPLIAALISESSIVIENIDGSGSQGDDKIVQVLQNAGADIVWDKKAATLTVTGGKRLHGNQTINISDFPDAICALSVIACFIDGTTTFTDVEICRKKETDRIKAMKEQLTKLSANVEEGDDTLIIHGHSPILEDGQPNPEFKLHGGEVQTYKDHRIVMSLACLALGLDSKEELIVNDAEWCRITFPNFFQVMNAIGAGFTEI
ncbi:MAG: 3-phosphoshikimate 1-carboxyvinyltransferase [Treponema sp.]|nr:3-phosphoshikimate 1-carboxyvinyltransferase [Treponema sp.]